MNRPYRFELHGGGSTIIDLDDIKQASICFIIPPVDPDFPDQERKPVAQEGLTIVRLVWGENFTFVAPLMDVMNLIECGGIWGYENEPSTPISKLSADYKCLVDDVIGSARVVLEAWNLEVSYDSAQFKRFEIAHAVRDLSTALLGLDAAS